MRAYAYADEAKAKASMSTNADLRGVNGNWNESVKLLRFDVDQDKARRSASPAWPARCCCSIGRSASSRCSA